MMKRGEGKNPNKLPGQAWTPPPRTEDPYLASRKLSDPTVCPDCGVVYHNGRWSWQGQATSAEKHRCPACSRIHDHVPAGVLSLGGEYYAAHQEEILQLIRNLEAREKAHHPLERIMSVEVDAAAGRTLVNFTGIHLTHGAAQAVHAAHAGTMSSHYTDRDALLHASWER